jgi:hypothetical protein
VANHSSPWNLALGLSHSRACALVAAVTAFDLDGLPVWSSCVTALVARNGGTRRAGEDLVDLMRAGYLASAGQIHQVPLYRPTGLGMAVVREWAGRSESAAAE